MFLIRNFIRIPYYLYKPIYSRFSSSDYEPLYKIHTNNKMSPKEMEIRYYIANLGLDFKENELDILIKHCPICPRPHNEKPDNEFKLYIHKLTGVFHCFRCGQKGTWNHLLKVIQETNYQNFIETPESFSQNGKSEIIDNEKAYLYCKNLFNEKYQKVLQYLTGKNYKDGERGLQKETIQLYKVGAGYEKFRNENNEYCDFLVVYFPMYTKYNNQKENNDLVTEAGKFLNTDNFKIVKLKVRAIGKENKSKQRIEPSSSKYKGLFGFNTVPIDAKSIIITEGEFDAMAAFEATRIPSISLPNGANNLPIEALPWLEKFEKIYLWMDADQAGRNSIPAFCKKIGINKTYVIDTIKNDINGPKDANDALRFGFNIPQYLKEARPLIDNNIVTFKIMKTNILKRIVNYEDSKGLKSNCFAWINKKLKGFRKGELSVYTGSTGSGKTTLISQIALDFLNQGVPTLWGSFEVKNEALAMINLIQFAKQNLIMDQKNIELFVKDFEALPLYFMKFHGSTSIEKVISTIDYAIYSYDISHIIIDNLQFFLSGQAKGFERFDLQDEVITKLRQIASDRNIHISIVIHPKKVDEESQDLSISSVFGSAKATQEADNIFIIQNRHKYRHLDIRKNRFDGETGRAALGFDKETRRFFELEEAEVQELHSSKQTIISIIENRKKKYGEIISPEISKEKPVIKSEIKFFESILSKELNLGKRKINKTNKDENTITNLSSKEIKQTTNYSKSVNNNQLDQTNLHQEDRKNSIDLLNSNQNSNSNSDLKIPSKEMINLENEISNKSTDLSSIQLKGDSILKSNNIEQNKLTKNDKLNTAHNNTGKSTEITKLVDNENIMRNKNQDEKIPLDSEKQKNEKINIIDNGKNIHQVLGYPEWQDEPLTNLIEKNEPLKIKNLAIDDIVPARKNYENKKMNEFAKNESTFSDLDPLQININKKEKKKLFDLLTEKGAIQNSKYRKLKSSGSQSSDIETSKKNLNRAKQSHS